MSPTTAPPMTKPPIHSTTNQTTPTRSLLMPRDIGTAPSLLECCATARRRHVVVRDGDPEAGDPIQYDELRIEHDQGDVEIVVYNRAILLFMTDSEPVRRVHEACLDDLATGRREA